MGAGEAQAHVSTELTSVEVLPPKRSRLGQPRPAATRDARLPRATSASSRNDLSPKPAYTALRSMMSATADTEAATAGGSAALWYAISDPDVEQVLLGKSDGSFVLALWRHTAPWDPNMAAPTAVAEVPVTLTLPDASAVTAQRLGDTGDLTGSSVTLDGDPADLVIGGEVTFLQIS